MTFQERLQFLLLVFETWGLALSHRHFQLAIPNGDRVPHPCGGNIDQSWQGAGHINPLGGGARNPFGEAFATNHFKWTELLCRADSDGDGRTNGEELGDPACHWIPGTDFHRKPLSHPGICEPLDAPVCAGKNSFLACREDENFACDAINESETFGLSIKLPQTPVPIRSTSSVCMDFEFTYDVIHHLVATSPIIGTGGVAHSIHVYACASAKPPKIIPTDKDHADQRLQLGAMTVFTYENPYRTDEQLCLITKDCGGPSRPLRSPYECETESMLCQNLIAVWRKGLKGECHGPDVGIPVGGSSDSGYRYATMQVQLTNPDLQANIEDSSGLDFFLTPKLRTHSAGYFYFGPRYLEIPPGVPQHTAQGRLKDHCTREVLQGPIKVLRVLGQMHSAGVYQETTLRREGRINNYLAVDNPYSWEQSREHWHPGGVEVRPGDELLTTCKYNTTGRHVTTFWGEGDRDEQCFAHILYYPRKNIVNPHFNSWGSIEPCEMILGKTAQSCELDMWRDPNHNMGVVIREKVQEKCRPGKCLEECMAYVRDVKMTACFHGDVDTYLREPINMTSQERLVHLHHYAALDSCDVQLARERCKMAAGGATKAVLHVVLMVVLFTCQELGEGDKPKRGAWGNQLEFILTMIGFAVGLGNVWRFPYLCYRNGGGAFLIPYFTCLVVLGVPIFFMELCFGQFASLGPLKIWRMNPACKGIGMSVTMITACIVVYYNVIVAYCVHYFFASMTSRLPWTSCDQDWNTCFCRDLEMDQNSTHPWPNGSRLSVECGDMGLINKSEIHSPSEEYFLNKVLKRSSGLAESGSVLWDVSLCNLFAWTVIFLVLNKGVETLGKVMYFAAVFPYILLTVLLVRGLTLEGHSTGIDFYLQPNVTKLSEARVWSDAAVQIFYSLGICQGGLIAMSSFNQFKTNTLRDSLIVPIVNCGTSFYAGFVIFSVLGFMAEKKGVSVASVVADGPGLTFMVYPEALAQMPVSPLWSVLFFLMMTMLGFSSQFSATETIFSSLMDEFPSIRKSRKRMIMFRAGGCLTFFLLALPMTTNGGFYLLNLIDNYVGGFPLLFAGIFEIIAIIYIYGFGKFRKDIEMMLGRTPMTNAAFFFFGPTWCFITPLCLMGVIVFKAIQYKPLTMDEYDYPDFGDAIGWLAAIAPIIIVPAYMIGYFCFKGGAELCWEVNTPKEKWGPSKEEDRGHRYAMPVSLFTIEGADDSAHAQVDLDQHIEAKMAAAKKDAKKKKLHGDDDGHDNKAFTKDQNGAENGFMKYLGGRRFSNM